MRDLVDLVLLMDSYDFDSLVVAAACQATFSNRGAHKWPPAVEAPSASWNVPYQRLRDETDIRPRTATAGHDELVTFLDPVVQGVPAHWDRVQRSWSATG